MAMTEKNSISDITASRGHAEFDPRMNRLLEIISTKSIVRSSTTTIFAPNGTPQPWLVDLRKTFFDPEGLDILADLFWDRFIDKLPFQVGGLEVGSVPLTSAIQLHGLRRGIRVNGFVVRKERKNYGLTKTYEGELTDDPIVAVDDLINSAETVEKVRAVLAQNGRRIRDLFVVVDYQNPRGLQWLSRNGVRLESLFTLEEFGLRRGGGQSPAKQVEFAEAWQFAMSGGHYFYVGSGSTPTLDDERLYYGSDGGDFWALDQRTGLPVWTFRLEGGAGSQIRSSPAVQDGRVCFGASDGNLYCLDAATGRELWRYHVGDRIDSSPAVAPSLGLLFVGLELTVPARGGSVTALQLATGEKAWEFAVESPVHGSPIYDAQLGLVACGTSSGDLLLLDAAAGTLRWRVAVGGEVKAAPAFDRGRHAVVAATVNGFVRSVELATGRVLWTVKVGEIDSTPLVVDDQIYVASTDKHLYLLNAAHGKLILKLATTGKNHSSPRAIGGRIYFGSSSGIVYEFDPRTNTISGQIQLPERILDAVVHSPAHDTFYAKSYDGKIYAFTRNEGVGVQRQPL
jgi:outer membrane protein assembly factor BamB